MGEALAACVRRAVPLPVRGASGVGLGDDPALGDALAGTAVGESVRGAVAVLVALAVGVGVALSVAIEVVDGVGGFKAMRIKRRVEGMQLR